MVWGMPLQVVRPSTIFTWRGMYYTTSCNLAKTKLLCRYPGDLVNQREKFRVYL